jgi:hypothetical protein
MGQDIYMFIYAEKSLKQYLLDIAASNVTEDYSGIDINEVELELEPDDIFVKDCNIDISDDLTAAYFARLLLNMSETELAEYLSTLNLCCKIKSNTVKFEIFRASSYKGREKITINYADLAKQTKKLTEAGYNIYTKFAVS